MPAEPTTSERQYDRYAPAYDIVHRGLPGDVDFYCDVARSVRGEVLELGVGTGRVAIPAATRGARIVGVDSSARMLARAKERSDRAGLGDRLELVNGDMRTLSLGRTFEVITLPYRSFLHLLSAEEQLTALAAIRAHLAPGGRVVLDFFVPSPESLTPARAGSFGFEREAVDPTSGHRVHIVGAYEFEPYAQLATSHHILEEFDAEGRSVSRTEYPLTVRWITRFEALHLFARAGFRVESLLGYFDRRPFDASSTEMIFMLSAA